MPARLSDHISTVNLLDWGCKGDGVTDDTAKFQAAIDKAYSFVPGTDGGIVQIPPGVYFVTRPIRISRLSVQGQLSIRGAGRAATIIKGNFPGFIMRSEPGEHTTFQDMSDLTIWNQSQDPASGALFIDHNGRQMRLSNLDLIGYRGLELNNNVYNTALIGLHARCSVPIQPANSATHGCAPLSAGLFIGQGELSSCTAVGFDCGIFVFGTGTTTRNCIVDRCNKGLVIGGPTFTPAGQNTAIQNPSIYACRFNRCTWGMEVEGVDTATIAANIFDGREGPADPATITNMSWNATTHVVTVTSSAHKISVNQPIVITPTNAAWISEGSGSQIVNVANRTSNTFDYPGPATNPGTFTGGTWNYPIEYGITVFGMCFTGIYSNIFPHNAAYTDFDMRRHPAAWNARCMLASMHAKFTMQSPSGNGNSSTEVLQTCMPVTPITGSNHNPLCFMFFNTGNAADPPGSGGATAIGDGAMEGMERNCVDASPAAWGAVVTDQGSNHYKMRFDGTNWLRSG